MRYTVRQAADILGISESAIRNRLSRGTLEGVKVDGVTHVVLGDIPPTDETTDARDDLIAVLKEQLAAEREAHSETRRIAAMLAARVPELEARQEEDPPEDAGGPETGARRPWWRRWFGG